MSQGKSCLKDIGLQNEAITRYRKIVLYTNLRNQIQENGLFSCKERPQHQEPFELGKHDTLDVAHLSSEDKIKSTDNV